LKTGALALTCNIFVRVDDEKTKKQGRLDKLQLLAAILARWRHLVAFNKALTLLYREMHAVLYQRSAAAIKMASLLATFFCRCFVCCCPGGRWGDTERVVARWQRPVASGVALDMLHWVIFLSRRQTAMAIEMANDGGTC
jgi:hypothetical protein